MATKQTAKKKSARVLLVGGSKGGSGKSTFAVNMAAMRAARGGKVVLIDTDTPQKSANEWVEDRNTNPDLYGSVLCHIQNGPNLIPMVLDMKEQSYTDIIIDVAGQDTPELRRAWNVANMIAIPMQLGSFSLKTLKQLRNVHEDAQAMNPNIAVPYIFLRTDPGVRQRDIDLAEREIKENTQFEIAQPRFVTRVAHRRASDIGFSTEEAMGRDGSNDDQDAAVREIRAIYEFIYGNQ